MKNHEMMQFLNERAQTCAKKEEALRADERADEACFERIRANVYDIFKAVLATAEKVNDNAEEAARFFTTKLEQLPTGWSVAYDKAVTHGNARQSHIESIKLETVETIRREWRRIGGETT